MSKIESSEHKDFIDEMLLNTGLSLDAICTELRTKRNFHLSKSTLAAYKKQLEAIHNESANVSYDTEIQNIINNENSNNYKDDHLGKKKLLNEMYTIALNNAYKVTKVASKKGKLLPLNLYKSIREIQNLIKGQNELLK